MELKSQLAYIGLDGWKDGVLYKCSCRSKVRRGIAQLGIDTCYTNEDNIIALFNTIFE
jgi:hypothetical protein